MPTACSVSENQLVGSTWTPRFYGYDGHDNVRLAWLVRRCSRLELTIRSQSIKDALQCFLYPKLPSVVLHVVEFTFSRGFDSFRAHHSFQGLAHHQARTEALYRGVEKARVGAYGLEAHGTLTAHQHGVNPSVETIRNWHTCCYSSVDKCRLGLCRPHC